MWGPFTMPMKSWLAKYWFTCVLLSVTLVTLIDTNEWVVGIGLWLEGHHGPSAVIVLIFFFSGIVLEPDQLRKGLVDLRTTLVTLVVIFIMAPLVALTFVYAPLDKQIVIGLFLIAVMPSTLSSGVVMTGIAGGNTAQALMVTLVSNILAVFTIPVVLNMLLISLDATRSIEIDKWPIMRTIALLVLPAFFTGFLVRLTNGPLHKNLQAKIQYINQGLVVTIVWIALCASRRALVGNLDAVLPASASVFIYHLVLIALAFGSCFLLRLTPGRRESVIFIGGQKTLPLSVILQVKLFPEYGLALAVCLLHHIIHLVMDGYLVQKIKNRQPAKVN